MQALGEWLAGALEAPGRALFQLLAFLLVLGVVVLFHEWGHFLAARAVGVRVEVFSLGFGRRLLGWRRGATDYRISAIPLGGYVRMYGDGIEQEATGDPEEFESRRAWEKLVILAAGPVFNGILAVLLLMGAFMVGMEQSAHVGEEVRVEAVVPSSTAEVAGLRAGDIVRSADGRPLPTWESFDEYVIVRPGARIELGIERDGVDTTLPVEIETSGPSRLGRLGVHPCHKVLIGRVFPGSAADDAGLQVGDEILDIDGRPSCAAEVLVGVLKLGEDDRHVLRIARDDEELEVEIAARWNEEEERWLIGIAPGNLAREIVTRKYGPRRALSAAVAQNWRWTRLLFDTLGRLVTGRLSVRTMSGPLEIASVASQTLLLGFVQLLTLMAYISLNLGILNLLPIPILDGGRMAIVSVEAVRGRELEMMTKEWILRVGFAMIVSLMVVVLFFDVLKRFGG